MQQKCHPRKFLQFTILLNNFETDKNYNKICVKNLFSFNNYQQNH